MNKLILIFSLFTISLFNIVNVKAETIQFDTADMTFVNYYSNHFGYELDANVSEFNKQLWTWTIPASSQLIYESGGIISSVLFYAGPDQTDFIEEVDIFDLVPTGPYPQFLSGEYQFNLLDYGFTEQEINNIRSVRVRIMVNFVSPPSGFANYLQDNLFLISGELPTVTFIHEGSVWFETFYLGTIDEPPTEPTTVNGTAFDTWYDIDGNVLNTFIPYQGDQVFFSQAQNLISILYYSQNQLVGFQTVTRNQEVELTLPSDPIESGLDFLWWELPDGTIVNDEIFYTFNQQTRINAVFRIAPDAVTTPAIGVAPINGLTTILSGFGLNNQLGYIFFMLLVFVPLNLFFAWLALPVIGIAIANLILIALFIYLQFIPFWFAFIIVAFIILAVIAMAKGVIRLE